MQILYLAHGHGHVRLRKHAHGVFHRSKLRHDLCRFAFPFHLHILLHVQTVLCQQVGKHILRSGALAGGIDRLASKAGHIRYGFAAFFQNIQHTQGIYAEHFHIPLHFAVKHGSQVDRHGENIQLALNKQRRQFISRTGQGERIVVLCFSGFVILQQLDHAHGGWPRKAAQANGGFRFRCRRFCQLFRGSSGRHFRRYSGGLRLLGCRWRAGCQAQSQKQAQKQGDGFLHNAITQTFLIFFSRSHYRSFFLSFLLPWQRRLLAKKRDRGSLRFPVCVDRCCFSAGCRFRSLLFLRGSGVGGRWAAERRRPSAQRPGLWRLRRQSQRPAFRIRTASVSRRPIPVCKSSPFCAEKRLFTASFLHA